MKRTLLLATLCGLLQAAYAQSCSPSGNETSYVTNNVWIGYLYNNSNFTSYRGYVNEGTAGNPNFDQSFGGSNVSYSTNSCTVNTETFSARYKLRKTFANAAYEFTVGGDDGYRLSLDGGATWVINQWGDQAYQTTTYTTMLSGSYNIVLEYYENTGDNRISFAIAPGCMGTENTSVYGTTDTWKGYVYDGMNFNIYKGMISQGSFGYPNFIQDFGGSNVTFATSSCGVQTETFSVRYRLLKNFSFGQHTFIIGGDDGYRFSLDGGLTWAVNQWGDQSYTTTTYTATFGGVRSLVIEYYENGGDNRVGFTYQYQFPLDIKLLNFTGKEINRNAELNWEVTPDSDPDHFDVEKSMDGSRFNVVATIAASAGIRNASAVGYYYTDANITNGKQFYRLKMTDQSGIITYSRTIVITNAVIKDKGISVFPTIVQDNTIFIKTGQTLQQATADLIDMNGRLLSSHHLGKLTTGQTVSFNVPGSLTKGIYIIRVMEKGVVAGIQKVVVNQ